MWSDGGRRLHLLKCPLTNCFAAASRLALLTRVISIFWSFTNKPLPNRFCFASNSSLVVRVLRPAMPFRLRLEFNESRPLSKGLVDHTQVKILAESFRSKSVTRCLAARNRHGISCRLGWVFAARRTMSRPRITIAPRASAWTADLAVCTPFMKAPGRNQGAGCVDAEYIAKQ